VHPEQDACSRFLGEEAIGRDLTSKEFNLKGCIIDDSQLWEEYVNSLDFQLSLNVRPFKITGQDNKLCLWFTAHLWFQQCSQQNFVIV
jgi:hypothetical protein